MKVVDFDTARDLANAGMIQPEPKFGTFWYNWMGDIYAATNTPGLFIDTDGNVSHWNADVELYYAPVSQESIEFASENRIDHITFSLEKL